jgi:hypothetical protein
VLDPAGCEAYEPALKNVRGKFVGGLLLPNDETGDCFKFTQKLAEMAKRWASNSATASTSSASPPKATRSPAWSPRRAN